LLLQQLLLLVITKVKATKVKQWHPHPAQLKKPLKDGFYVGAQLGYDSYRASESVNATIPGTPPVTINGSRAMNATGWVGGLLAGYGQYFQDLYYLAGEIMVNTSGASQNDSFSTSTAGNVLTTKFSANTSYGIRLLPGIKLNNSALLYIPLGYMSASLKGTANSFGGIISSSKSQYSGGFVYGVGIETAIYENFSLRGEYTHTNNNSFSSNGVKWSPSDNQFMLGLLYHFA